MAESRSIFASGSWQNYARKMEPELRLGDHVRVRLFGGKRGMRRVVGFVDGVPLVCTEGEYDASQREGREPRSIGCPPELMVDPA
jgi:hypothetical protein